MCTPQCRDARLERPLNHKVEKKHNHLSLQHKLPKTQIRKPHIKIPHLLLISKTFITFALDSANLMGGWVKT